LKRRFSDIRQFQQIAIRRFSGLAYGSDARSKASRRRGDNLTISTNVSSGSSGVGSNIGVAHLITPPWARRRFHHRRLGKLIDRDLKLAARKPLKTVESEFLPLKGRSKRDYCFIVPLGEFSSKVPDRENGRTIFKATGSANLKGRFQSTLRRVIMHRTDVSSAGPR